MLAAANARARELGVDVLQSLVSITHNFEHGLRWRVNYGPKNYVGRRGGDLLVEVDGEDLSIRQVLHGQ